jgi:hypothetical protein
VKKSGLILTVTVIVVILFSVSLSVVCAQYQTSRTSDVQIPASGVSHVSQSLTVGGVSIDIAGTPGAIGSVSTAVYNGNPQPGASVPADVKLAHFVVVTFNFATSDFSAATIQISFTDSDVEGMSTPYALYKYDPQSNSYTKLNAVFDTIAKTATVTVTSTTDPLFAIGGKSTTQEEGLPFAFVVGVVALVLVIVAVVAVLLLRSRKPSYQMLEQHE